MDMVRCMPRRGDRVVNRGGKDRTDDVLWDLLRSQLAFHCGDDDSECVVDGESGSEGNVCCWLCGEQGYGWGIDVVTNLAYISCL